ncbi:MAG: glycosyltransferase, partial [Cupriavidus sp.]
VQWAGQQADTSAYYRQADAFLMLSRFEAMPFVVLEAMASGTPVVACAVGGVPEAVEHGRNGVLLPERTSAALVAQVRSLMADPKHARSLGREARRTVESRFTSEHMVQGFLDVVSEVRRRKALETGA